MKNLFRLGLLTLILLMFTTQTFAITEVSKSKKKKPVIAVISDSAHRNGTTYLICGASSDIIASDLVNAINQSRHMQAPLLGDTMAKMTDNKLNVYKYTFFQEYRSNYNIDFVNLKRLTKNIEADYILMITSGLDIQSNFLKDTWWNKLNISGVDVVKPTYKLTTLLTLVNKRTYEVVWQDLYQKDISARNYDLGTVQFSPGYAQLTKIKKYSKRVSEHVVPIIDANVNPELQPPKEPKTVELKNIHINEDKRLYYPVIHTEEVKKKVDKANKKFQAYQKKIKDNRAKRIDEKNKAKQVPQDTKTDTKMPDSSAIHQINNSTQKNKNLVPAVNTIQNKSISPAQEIVQPAMIKQQEDKIIQQKFIKPTSAVKKQVNTESQVDIAPPDKNPTPRVKQQVDELPVKSPPRQFEEENSKELPLYDWNIKNIYLKDIGSQLFYEKQANVSEKL